PCGAQVVEHKLARNQGLLQPIAQHDMARIANLVGVNANKARLNTGIEAAKVFGAKRPVPVAKRLLQQGSQKLEEVRASADLHLDQEGLALMDRHAAGEPHRLVTPSRRAA